MRLMDMNGDGSVSDVDAAFQIEDRLVALYGPDLAVGDLDGNGVINGEDVVAAIAAVIKVCFGKATAGFDPVSVQDVQTVMQDVQGQSIKGDINFDGSPDVQDVAEAISHLGEEVSEFDIDRKARELFEYIGAIREHGREAFMANAPAPSTHLAGVSNTWPPFHPSWWPPNHLPGISQSYLSPPGAPEHDSAVSASWPANHLRQSSATWPPTHSAWSSAVGPTPTPNHSASTSATWPSGHSYGPSSTWPVSHEQNTSRTWWPQHNAPDSASHIVPPMHMLSITNLWEHTWAVSQLQWPPNHYPSVSDGWGPAHQMGVSASYPPGHLNYASQSWPGPQPSWPPTHTYTVSASWGEPAPGVWPVFPPGHSWWTTFQNLVPFPPRLPWMSEE
jgi:hypothetical protein